MNIRKASKSDRPEIIQVLKASLGESNLPLTDQIWQYKHIENPFGESLVLLAEDKGQITGVRAFMRWQWQKGNKKFSTFRAVDTATHPHFQGKGIFKNLTMSAVDSGIKANENFVFNTPNEQSKPGYLKMGWEEVGKIKVALKPNFLSFFKISKNRPQYETQYVVDDEGVLNLCKSWNDRLISEGKLFTPKSPGFLKWRYENNPLQKYEVYATPDLYIAAYVKKRGSFKEFRVSELIFRTNYSQSEIKSVIKKLSKKFAVHVISYSPQLFYKDPLAINGDFGPVLTIRNLVLHSGEFDDLKCVKGWNYSLGDLELF